MPAYTAAACIIVFGLIFPLYRVYGIVLVAVIAAAAYFFSKKYFFKDKIIQEESEPVFRTGIAELDESLERPAPATQFLPSLTRIPKRQGSCADS